ncbi:fructose PTS transporter subunit IIB [Propionimicrobium sp. PCR01-08-3]|uniref:PTS fructose transporter subunit IIB n=1 Tax=Propionimicrobium sp. PCR01-08-3 TaxID=3052086 RepID=UPI00255CEAD9|nr:fructose PTS transporter subunit IIB [Propionimicrobium sp. PCR01-08-3]WIY83242.1 fructose PTS transporter subunit IIB [Propionimicrobium sp. PCR01-08-3]
MKIVAVTSCATGIAHSYMAAEAIEKICKKQGFKVKVEIQGAMGIENALSNSEISAADAVVLANDVAVSKADRFKGHEQKTVRLSPHKVIQNPEAVVHELETAHLIKEG